MRCNGRSQTRHAKAGPRAGWTDLRTRRPTSLRAGLPTAAPIHLGNRGRGFSAGGRCPRARLWGAGHIAYASTLRRRQDEAASLLECLGALHVRAAAPLIDAINGFRKGRAPELLVDLPRTHSMATAASGTRRVYPGTAGIESIHRTSSSAPSRTTRTAWSPGGAGSSASRSLLGYEATWLRGRLCFPLPASSQWRCTWAAGVGLDWQHPLNNVSTMLTSRDACVATARKTVEDTTSSLPATSSTRPSTSTLSSPTSGDCSSPAASSC